MRVRPFGVMALALFFLFGTVTSGLTALMLSFPGSMLDPIWRLNPSARAGLTPMGLWAICLMAVVSASCATAALGLLRCERYGYRMALTILCVNLLADASNAFISHDWRTLIIGLPIGGALILYLLSRRNLFPN